MPDNDAPRPLMSKAVAVWLVDNTSLTFQQIASFCGLHHLEVRSIADGDVALGVRGHDPVASGQLSREEIDRCQNDPNSSLTLSTPRDLPYAPQKRRAHKYTPISVRRDRPDAIAWIARNHPEITDAQIAHLIGTTKSTIVSVRNRTHWNSSNIKPVDPVTLGLCTQTSLDEAVQKAAARAQKSGAPIPQPPQQPDAVKEHSPESVFGDSHEPS